MVVGNCTDSHLYVTRMKITKNKNFYPCFVYFIKDSTCYMKYSIKHNMILFSFYKDNLKTVN